MNKNKNKNEWFLKGGRGSGRTIRLLCEVYENKIADLERKLEQTEKELFDYQFNYPKLKELQKENTELREKLNSYERGYAYEKMYELRVKAESKLIKAKEIIEMLYPHAFQGLEFMELNDYNVQKAEVEQFLKELAK